MAQTRTSAFIASAEAGDTKPILLVRAYLSGSTRYWTSLVGTYGGQAYTELLKTGVDVSIGVDALGRAMRSIGRITLANEDDGSGVRASDILTEYVAGRAIQADLLFQGLTHPTDSLRIFTGMLEVPDSDCFDDQAVRLNLLDDGNPLWAGIQDLACARIHKIIGPKITAADYPSADPDVIGRVEPTIYGSINDSPALAVVAGGADLLRIDHTSSVGTLTCSDATNFAVFPASGTVICDGEEITYTGKGTLTLTGCTRGANGTTAAAHAAGATIYEKLTYYHYKVACHVCKNLTNVRVGGILKTEGVDYTWSTSGLPTPGTYISFLAKPKVQPPVSVTAQPTFSATTTAEQSPGAISTTAEQAPGSISTTAEQGVSTNTGSHGHTSDVSTHDYPSDPSFPTTTKTATFTVTMPHSGKAGTTANWHCVIGLLSGTWTFRDGDGTTILTPTGTGDFFFSQSSVPGTTYSWNLSGSGNLIVTLMERDLITTAATTSDAATGVAASLTGATASTMASLSGSTASNMATLAGSTAVSLSRTQNVAASAADVVIGTEVLCDVEGYADDGSGTYTGTPNALITNPADQIRHIMAVQLGLTLADWADSTVFTAARAAFASSSIRCDWALYDQIDSAELLERIRWSVASRLFQGAAGKFKCFPLPLSASSSKTFTEAADVLDESSGGGPISVGRTALSDLYNQVYVLYGKYITGTGYAGYATASDATSQTNYRMIRTLIVENDFIRDATAAQAIADIYLAWHKDQKWRAAMIVDAMPSAHLEPCDKISITSSRMPGAWSAKAFFIESISERLLPSGQKSAATIVCREA